MEDCDATTSSWLRCLQHPMGGAGASGARPRAHAGKTPANVHGEGAVAWPIYAVLLANHAAFRPRAACMFSGHWMASLPIPACNIPKREARAPAKGRLP